MEKSCGCSGRMNQRHEFIRVSVCKEIANRTLFNEGKQLGLFKTLITRMKIIF